MTESAFVQAPIDCPTEDSAAKDTRKSAYIAGPISGCVDYNRESFDTAAKILEVLGYLPVNPSGQVEGWSWEDYMKRGIRQLLDCEVVVMLPGWADSNGASLENHIAQELSKEVWDLEDLVSKRTYRVRDLDGDSED